MQPIVSAYMPALDQVIVLGAAGRTGAHVVQEALNQGLDVVALTRPEHDTIQVPVFSNGGKPTLLHSPKLRVLRGSATALEDVRDCFKNANNKTGVVLALGGKTKDVGNRMLEEGTRNAIQCMQECGAKRIAAITSIGTGDSYDQAPLFFKGLMATIYRDMFRDKNAQESVLMSSDLEWCIVRPGGLVDRPSQGDNMVLDKTTIAGSIPRIDVARFCLDAVGNPNFDYIGKAPCLSNMGAVRDHN